MSKSLAQVLGYVTLTGSIQATTRGLPNPFPAGYMRGDKGKKVVGNKGKYTRYTGQRKTARLNKYGSPAKRQTLMPVGEVDVKLFHVFEELSIDPLVMKQLRSKDSYEQDRGMEEVGRQLAEYAALFSNLEIAMLAQLLKNGVHYWDAEGNLLPSSSGAVETFSYQMSANNQNQLNGLITASWALNNTDIPLQLRNLKKRSARLTGMPVRKVLYGENIPTYLAQNDFVHEFLIRNPTQNADFLQSGEIGSLFGLEWIPVYEAFYEDADGTNRDLWDADMCVFTPEPDTSWLEWLEGSYELPKSIDIVPSETVMGNFETTYGKFAYAKCGHNPPTATVYTGDTALPVLKVPDAIFQADVTP